MSKEQSVAPRERINIVYKPAINMDEEVELPLKMVVLADFTGRPDDTPVEDRRVINVDKDNFNNVLREQQLEVSFGVKDKLNPNAQPGDEIPIQLRLESLKSFEPEQIARQIPELNELLEVREALVALKGPLGNIKQFSKKLKEVLGDEAARERLIRELSDPPAEA